MMQEPHHKIIARQQREYEEIVWRRTAAKKIMKRYCNEDTAFNLIYSYPPKSDTQLERHVAARVVTKTISTIHVHICLN